MKPTIDTLLDYVNARYASDAKVFSLYLDEQFHVVSHKGAAEHYGYSGVATGLDMSDPLVFLVGLDQAETPLMRLDYVEMPSGVQANVFIAVLEQGWGVVFVDATKEHDEVQRHQQIANENNLLNSHGKRLSWNEMIGSGEIGSEIDKTRQSNEIRSRFIQQINLEKHENRRKEHRWWWMSGDE